MKRFTALVLAVGMVLGIAQSIYAWDGIRPLSAVYPEIVDIVAGGYHSIALDRRGDVFTFGSNRYGELGLGYASDEGIVYDVSMDDAGRASRVSSRSDHILAVENKKAYAWGRNDYGQLGTGDRVNQASITPVRGLEGLEITAVAAGHQFSLALDANGNVYAWGHNGYGQLGNGSGGAQAAVPVKVNISGVEQISAGHYHALVKKTDGTVWGWGRNMNGALGAGSAEFYSAPVQIPITGVKVVTAGMNNSFFQMEDGTVYACGENTQGQLGDGSKTSRTAPVLIDGLSEVCQISSNTCTIFLKTDGTAYGTGNNNYGQLGLGENIGRVLSPTKIPGEGYTKVSTGGGHTLLYWGHTYSEGSDYGGKIYAMGRNQYSQCGDKNQENIYYPTEVKHIREIDDRETFVPLEQLREGARRMILPAAEDTYVSQHGEESAKNFAGAALCGINYTRSENGTGGWGQYAYLKFNTGEIPKDRLISAKLWVYVDESSDKRNSTRTIGVYDTRTRDWDGTAMTWENGRVSEGDRRLGTFEVTGNGSIIEDAGWRAVDVTEYLAGYPEDVLGIMAKMVSTTAHPVNIRASGPDSRTAPQLVVEYAENPSYNWERTSAGGGGAVFAPQINPYDPNMIMASCDMTGNYFSYDGGRNFSMYPTQYMITSIHAASQDEVYMAGSTVLKSTDRGRSFTQIYPPPNEFGFTYRGLTSTAFYISNGAYCYKYTSVVTPKDSPEDVFFLRCNDRKSTLYYSNNGGDEFTDIYMAEGESSVNKIYAGQTVEGVRVYLFRDDGVTRVDVLKNEQEGVYTIEARPLYSGQIKEGAATGDTIYVVRDVNPEDSAYDEETDRYFSRILYRLEENTDGTMETVKISANLTEGIRYVNEILQKRSITQVEAAEDGTVMVGYGGNDDSVGVAVTEDGGQSWRIYEEIYKYCNIQTENSGYVQDRGWHGIHPRGIDIYDKDTFLFTTMFGGYLTTNGGTSWRQLENQPFDWEGNPFNEKVGDGVDKFSDSTGLDVTSVTSVLVDPSYPDRIMMNMMDMGGFISYDRGKTWKQCNYVKGEDQGKDQEYNMAEQLKWDSYGSVYIPGRDLMMTIWTSVNDMPKQDLSRYKDGAKILGCVAVSKNGGYSQIALNEILKKDSIPVSIKCFPKGDTGDYSIYICCFGYGIYRFELTAQMLKTQTDEELIQSFNNELSWQQVNAGLENSAEETSHDNMQTYGELEESVDKSVWYVERPLYINLLGAKDETEENISSDVAEENIMEAADNTESNLIQNGNNIYTYDIVEDNHHNLYTVISNAVGYPLTEAEIKNGSFGYKGGIYKLVKNEQGVEAWSQIPLPPETKVPNTIAFDADNAMYAGFYTTNSSGAMPYSWKGGGVYKTADDGESWEQILDDTKSVNHLLYDKRNGTLYIAGNAFGLMEYADGIARKTEGYDFSSTNRLVLGNGKLYACSRGAGLFIRSLSLD